MPDAKAAWDTRQGWLAVTLIVAVALLGWSAWSWWKQPKQPKFVAGDYMEAVNKNLEKWTPTDGWNLWVQYYRQLSERGLRPFQAANAAEIERKISEARFLRGMLLTLAAVFVAIAVAIAFWPKKRAKVASRHGK